MHHNIVFGVCVITVLICVQSELPVIIIIKSAIRVVPRRDEFSAVEPIQRHCRRRDPAPPLPNQSYCYYGHAFFFVNNKP